MLWLVGVWLMSVNKMVGGNVKGGGRQAMTGWRH